MENTPTSIMEALYLSTMRAVPAKPRRSWKVATTTEMPALALEHLRRRCMGLEATEVIESHDTAVTEWDFEPTTQPIPHETTFEIVYGRM